MKNAIYQQFNILPQELTRVGRYTGFWIRNKVYVLLPVNKLSEEQLGEVKKMSDFMIGQGETSVLAFVQTVHGYYVCEINDEQYILARCSRQRARKDISEGASLSLFHYYGKQFSEPVDFFNQIGQWKQLWEKRLEQLEKFWQNKVMSRPQNKFDELFIDTFPYYLGLTENAIQYLTDAELDDEPNSFDGATICHRKYSAKYWKFHQRIRIPFDWVIDHSSRDIAEWVRNEWLGKGVQATNSIVDFLQEYEGKTPLSSFAWRLLYSRLLFPLHYFEVVENYYQQENEQLQIQLERLIEGAEGYQKFLRDFFDMIGLPVGQLGIRRIGWL